MKIRYDIDPAGAVLRKFYLDRSRVSLVRGPLGSGKTFTTCLKILKMMIEQEPNEQGIRPSRWWAIRNTYSDLENTTAKDWLAVTEGLGVYKATYPMSHTLKFKLEDGTTVEAEMLFLALDRPESIKKLRGTQATGFWLNETKELPRAVIDMADLRHGRYPSMADGGVRPTYHGMVGDYNSPDEDHYLYELAEEIRPKNWAFFVQKGGVLKNVEGEWIPNPKAENLANLPDEYYLHGMEGKREDWISVNLGNEYGFVRDGKSVWPEYIDSIHCASEELHYDSNLPLYVGIDFGLTPAAVFMQQTMVGQYRIIDEIITSDMGAERFSDLIKEKIAASHARDVTITGDPAGDQRAQTDERTPFDILEAKGLIAYPANTNDPLIRIEAVAQQLRRLTMDGTAGLVISPSCKKLRKAMAGGYCYRRVQVAGDERFQDKPDKNMSSHVSDALQYCILGAGAGDAVVGWSSSYDPDTYNPDDYIRDVR